MFVLGILSACSAPFLMVLGFMIWDDSWNGSAFALNMFKCCLAGIGFLAVSYFSRERDEFLSAEVFTAEATGFLVVSSTIGILIGDWTWLEGMRLLGPRKVIVMDSLKPFLAAFLGRFFLGERLKPLAIVGLILTVIGTAMVGLEKDHAHEKLDEDLPSNENDIIGEHSNLISKANHNTKETKRTDSYAERRRQRSQSADETRKGLFWSISNVILHTFGALLTKKYGDGLSIWEIGMIRFGFAGVVMLLISLACQMHRACHAQTSTTQPDSRNSTSDADKAWFDLPALGNVVWARIILGVLFVSFLAPALTVYAMFLIPLALLLTLESIGPIYSLPLSLLLQNEIPTIRATFGAILAVAGIVVLSFRGMEE